MARKSPVIASVVLLAAALLAAAQARPANAQTSSASVTVNATSITSAPGSASSVTVAPYSLTVVHVPGSGATGVTAPGAGGTATLAATMTAASVTPTGLAIGTAHTYDVVAVDSHGNQSLPSPPVTFTVPPPSNASCAVHYSVAGSCAGG